MKRLLVVALGTWVWLAQHDALGQGARQKATDLSLSEADSAQLAKIYPLVRDATVAIKIKEKVTLASRPWQVVSRWAGQGGMAKKAQRFTIARTPWRVRHKGGVKLDIRNLKGEAIGNMGSGDEGEDVSYLEAPAGTYTLDIQPQTGAWEVYVEQDVVASGGVVIRQQTVSGGSGFAIADGSLIVTNWHVIEEVSNFLAQKQVAGRAGALVTLENALALQASDGSEIEFEEVVLSLPQRDLALLKVKKHAKVQPLRLAQDNQFSPLVPVLVVGHQAGAKYTPSTGLMGVSGNVADVPAPYKSWFIKDLAEDTTLVSFSARIAPGTSCGPGVNPDGLVVGVAQSLARVQGAQGLTQVNIGVHVKHVRELVRFGAPEVVLERQELSAEQQKRLAEATRTSKRIQTELAEAPKKQGVREFRARRAAARSQERQARETAAKDAQRQFIQQSQDTFLAPYRRLTGR